MTGLVTRRAHRLAESLAELKVKVRTALATELAGAVGGAVRDVLAAALLDRVWTAPMCPPNPSSRTGEWREHGYEDRGRWDGPRDSWDDTDPHDTRDRAPVHYERCETESAPPVPAAAALAVGVNVGRWWLGRHGSAPVAVGLGVLAAFLGLAGGPAAQVALAILAAATDLLTAESALARSDPS